MSNFFGRNPMQAHIEKLSVKDKQKVLSEAAKTLENNPDAKPNRAMRRHAAKHQAKGETK